MGDNVVVKWRLPSPHDPSLVAYEAELACGHRLYTWQREPRLGKMLERDCWESHGHVCANCGLRWEFNARVVRYRRLDNSGGDLCYACNHLMAGDFAGMTYEGRKAEQPTYY